MNRTIISTLILAIIATSSVTCGNVAEVSAPQLKSFQEVRVCVDNGFDLVEAIGNYIKERNWFDGPAVGAIVTQFGVTFNTCKEAFLAKADDTPVAPVAPEVPEVNELAAANLTGWWPWKRRVSRKCRDRLQEFKQSVETMRGQLRWKRFKNFVKTFKDEFIPNMKATRKNC